MLYFGGVHIHNSPRLRKSTVLSERERERERAIENEREGARAKETASFTAYNCVRDVQNSSESGITLQIQYQNG